MKADDSQARKQIELAKSIVAILVMGLTTWGLMAWAEQTRVVGIGLMLIGALGVAVLVAFVIKTLGLDRIA